MLIELSISRNYVILTHDDPEGYQGPINQAWPPSKNRSVPLYIEGKKSKTRLHELVKCNGS